jgi:hypothetical protein
MIPDANGYVPPEAIVGVHLVGPDGRPTGEFLRNPRYGPVRDDFGRLEAPGRWVGWLPDPPAPAIRSSIERILAEQVPGSSVEWLKVVANPAYLTGGRRLADDPTRVRVTRAAVAVPFALCVRPPTGLREILTGVFTWVAASLDTPNRQDRVWLDLGMTQTEAQSLLRQRIYELDAVR